MALQHRQGAHVPFVGFSPQVVRPLQYVIHGQCDVCNVRPVQCQTYGYLPSRRASPPIGRYQIILLGDGGIDWVKVLHATWHKIGHFRDGTTLYSTEINKWIKGAILPRVRTGRQGCEQLAQSCYTASTWPGLNLLLSLPNWPLDYKSDKQNVVPLCHLNTGAQCNNDMSLTVSESAVVEWIRSDAHSIARLLTGCRLAVNTSSR